MPEVSSVVKNRLALTLLGTLTAFVLLELIRDITVWRTLRLYHVFLTALATLFATTATATHLRRHSAPGLLRGTATAFLLYACIVVVFGTEDVGGLLVAVAIGSGCLVVSILVFLYASTLQDEFVR